jgi:hypothetical protein
MNTATATTSAPVAFNVRKGREGYEAQTDFELGNGKTLRVNTSKAKTGLVSYVQGCEFDDGCMSFVIFGDFTKQVSFPGTRCTEKNVREIHTTTIAAIESLKAEAAKFYAAQSK